MTSQNGLTTATTISLNFVNIQLQHKPQEVNRPHFTTAIDCKSHYDDGQCILKGSPLLNPNVLYPFLPLLYKLPLTAEQK